MEKPPLPGLAGAQDGTRAGDHIPSLSWDMGLGLTLATGSLLRVATRLSFLTWVLVFMASQMAFSVEIGMSCSKGVWVSPRGWGDPQGCRMSPSGCQWY